MAKDVNISSDDGILYKVAQGIGSAMETCISKYGGLVWSIARRYVKDHSSAEDVVQEIFTDLWKNARKYDPAIATECTFIGMLARRRAIDFARKQNRQPVMEPLPEPEALPESTEGSQSAVRCEREQVRQAINELPDETQKIFALHFDKGMTHPEIADQTGLPIGTVKTRLRRGIIEVRNILRRLDSGNQASKSHAAV